MTPLTTTTRPMPAATRAIPAPAALLALAALALGAGGAMAQSPLLDLDRADASPVLDLFDDGGFVAHGAFGTGVVPATGTGTRLMWYPGKAAFRAGRIDDQGPALWDDAQVGNYSTAFGIVPLASAPYAFAAGYLVEATNDGAAAFGFGTLASGFTSLAAGYQSEATGHSATALGRLTIASGAYSFAAGLQNQAQGYGSVALGNASIAAGSMSFVHGNTSTATGLYSFIHGNGNTAGGSFAFVNGFKNTADGYIATVLGRESSAGGAFGVAIGENVDGTGDHTVLLGRNLDVTHSGSFVFGDGTSTSNASFVTGNNQFAVRASGGIRLYSNPAASTGVVVAPGSSAWSSLSDVNAKENFRDLDLRSVLDAVEAMDIREWNYIDQDDDVRHIGPTAQSFHGAFGLGSDPLRIETIDADGVALAAIQALTRENRALRARVAELEALEDRVAALEAERDRLAALEDRLDALLAGLRPAGEAH
jgi:hypothetical protein